MVEWLSVTLSMYRKVFSRASILAAKNWPVLLTVLAYTALHYAATMIAIRMGMAGGFLMGFVNALCAGSFLYLVEMIVRTSKVSLEDLRSSIGQYLFDIIGVMFIFWILFFFLTPLLLQTEQGLLIFFFLRIVIFILFNAVPELIYLGHHSSTALLSESFEFVSANWIEWFPLNIVAALVIYAVAYAPIGGTMEIFRPFILGFLIYWIMVLRGLLFIELYGSTHRARAFKYRAGG